MDGPMTGWKTYDGQTLIGFGSETSLLKSIRRIEYQSYVELALKTDQATTTVYRACTIVHLLILFGKKIVHHGNYRSSYVLQAKVRR
jgi:hypothetical protein